MANTDPNIPVDGGVGPWILKYKGNLSQPDTDFLDQFVSPADSRCIEIAPARDDDGFRYTLTDLDQIPNLGEWLNPAKVAQLSGGTSPCILRLVILPLNVNKNDSLPVPWTAFERHLELLHLESSYTFSDKLQAPPGWFEIPLPKDLRGFMVKLERWDDDLTGFSLSVGYCPAKQVTCAVVHILLKRDMEHLLSRLQALKSVSWHPLLVSLILMETRMESLASDLAKVRSSLYLVEKRTGTHKNYHGKPHHELRKYYAYGKEVWKQGDDFESAPGKLTSIVSDCVMFEAKCRINEEFLSWLEKLNNELCEHKDSTEALSALSKDGIRVKISTMKTWSINNRGRSVYLGKRAEAQMQASLSLMAQRDNALNLKTSEAAVRDSADMRAIAWVTLGFLPATFIATFFSTTFFNFQEQGRHVSEWVWLYWVVALGLSTCVFGGWAWWSARDHRESDRKSGIPSGPASHV